MKRGKRIILATLTVLCIIGLTTSQISAKPTRQDPAELGYGLGYWLPMSFYYADGEKHDGPAQNFDTASITGDPELKSEHTRLCGEAALAYILRISPEEALRVFHTLGEGNLFDSQGTIFHDIFDYVALFHYQAEFIYDITSLADLQALLLSNTDAAGILLPIRIHTEDGALTFRADQSQYQTKHWVVVNYLYQQDGETWLNIYNPYYNIMEDYPLSFVYSSWDFEVMIINQGGN
jgi:hypothetical protein